MTFTVAIAGRPNVGKSTLFNRLVGKKLALVDDTPGVTRDWRAADAHLGGLSFTAVDTAGLEEAVDESLEGRLRRQTERALVRADVVLLVIDGRAGLSPLDRHFASWLRTLGRPVVVVANKCEGRGAAPGVLEAYELGLGDPVPISAEHGAGMGDLAEALLALAPDAPEPAADAEGSVGDGEEITGTSPERPLRLAIVGRPNVGKSTLLNRLIGEERVLTGPEPGMTRDAITVDWSWRDLHFRLVDTAGLRKRARVDEKLEKLAVADTLRAVRLAHVVVLVLDADAILDRQDLTIARTVIEEGRALVVAINKWDLVADRNAALGQLRDRLEASLPQARGVPTVTVSALKGTGLDGLLEAAATTYAIWNQRISTGQLNRWLSHAVEQHPPPLVEGRRVKLRYITQVKARPPTFAAFVSKPVDLPEAYLRYLINGLRETFGLPGVPIRILLRKGHNPYVES